ncbi:hypothetical protein MTO96_051973 [Rhipicephalus appendiculatus]
MSWRCAYLYCSQKYEPGRKDLSHHRFPLENPPLLQKWLDAMRQPGFKPAAHHTLCSAHFRSDDFRSGLRKRLLQEGAVPSLFEHPKSSESTHDVPQASSSVDLARHDPPTICDLSNQPSTSADQTTPSLSDHDYSSRECPEERVKRLGLSGEVLKNLVVEAICCITECGLEVVAVVCDCLAANVAMAKLLGCHVHEHTFANLKAFFPHPSKEDEVIFFLFDACHALKLLRNLLGDKGVLLSATYGTVLWKHIKALQELQEKEGLRAANKLTKAHIAYYQQIMKVKLAAQTFSSSVSKALEFASLLKLPGFHGCKGTAKFVAMVDR